MNGSTYAMSRRRSQASRLIADITDAILEVSVAGSFSRVGYAVRSRLLPEFTDSPHRSVSGQTVLITGATSGIGLAAAIRLASLGARVCFLARSHDRALQARERIAAASPDPGLIEFDLADLTDLDSVRAFAARWDQRHDRLDVLVHNAGALYPSYRTAPSGLEQTVAGQLVAPFLLTSLLLGGPLQRGRVITVSSGGMYTQPLSLAGLNPSPTGYRGATAYARVKRAQVELSREWARRQPGAGTAFHAMHPGWAATPGLTEALPRFARLMGPLLRTPQEGADTIVWLASADPELLGTGQFWLDRRTRPIHRFPGPGAADEAEVRRVWEWTATQAGCTEAVPGGPMIDRSA